MTKPKDGATEKQQWKLNGEHQFDVHSPLDEENKNDLQEWVDDGQLVGLVDEACGGIIGYINEAHADRIASHLNEREALLAVAEAAQASCKAAADCLPISGNTNHLDTLYYKAKLIAIDEAAASLSNALAKLREVQKT